MDTYKDTTYQQEVAFTKLALALAAVFYPLWGWVSFYCYQNKYDGLFERSPFFVACMITLLLSNIYRWTLSKTRLALNLILWGMTAHFFFILFSNPPNLITTAGTIAHMIGICSALTTRKELVAFMTFSSVTSFFVLRSIPGLDWILMWGLLNTIYLYFFIGAHFRSLLLNLVIIANKKTIEIGKLAAQAAHDIRSPLSALNIIFSSKHIQSIPEEEKALLTTALKRIEKTSEDLLTLQKDAVSGVQSRQIFDVPSALNDIITERAFLNKDTTISLYNDFDSFKIEGDVYCFQRAISNLIANSCEARANRIALSIQKDVNCFDITITDNGSGIDPIHLDKIFESQIITKKVNGTGIGLLGTKSLLSKLKMTIVLISSNESGTKFKIKIPSDIIIE